MKGFLGASVFAFFLVGVSVNAQDGAPDAKQDVRNVAVTKKLKELQNVEVLYVKGMT